MTTSKETIKEDQKADTQVDMLQTKSPKLIVKRKVLSEPVNTVKQCKVIEEKPADSFQCEECSKKLKFINAFTCRCEKSFCAKHRFHDQHSCSYDFKLEAKSKLAQQNPKVVARKLGE